MSLAASVVALTAAMLIPVGLDGFAAAYPDRVFDVGIAEQHAVTFAAGLRAILRQDPDVILVGELRDLETISLAITASETGHLVFSTLHTINAGQSINRILGFFAREEEEQGREIVSVHQLPFERRE